jgi:molybdate transport system permease protein
MIQRHRIERALVAAIGAVLLLFLAAPIVALFVTVRGAELLAGLKSPLVWPALRLSLFTTTQSLGLLLFFGTPFAWQIARSETRFFRIVESFVSLPAVIPPAVAGVALLLAFGRRGVLAGVLYPVSWSVSFTTVAVVIAETFVAAPFYVQSAVSAFRRIDPQLLLVARTFGASPLRVFLRLALPLAGSGLVAGAAMAWARALGEFGATLMFAGNLQGRTQTLPLAIYSALEADLRAAQALSILLVVVAFSLLVSVRSLLRRSTLQYGTSL